MTAAEPPGTPYSYAALGDGGPWVAALAQAWSAVADPQGAHLPPPDPLIMRERTDGASDHLGERIAYWGPFFHLVVFGMGWRRPDLGIERWHELGQPTDHPILAVVKGWWGHYVPDVLAWAANSPYFLLENQYLGARHPSSDRDQINPKWLEASRRDSRWMYIFGSGDTMHLSSHATTPVSTSSEPTSHLTTGPDESARAVLVCETYQGWYHELSTCGLTQTRHGSSWKVDVFVKPLGWLGTYRLSRQTGAWFSGQHRWHQLGWPRS
ncbi:hypothetical protein HH310_19885 [Actinoplanes sp. TBRC 11911]|uniref:hypothetical protein n=1 Tax=Actinoplanes sp. TBRC 11911 TaxID=2729386 RepID=UPI00145C5579|nr:hypothetical protein [Actinoplanes sp. TBRC 11911]NMO53437.1 hypothetical protein [Actinoplanes sp. TBRC 11911]